MKLTTAELKASVEEWKTEQGHDPALIASTLAKYTVAQLKEIAPLLYTGKWAGEKKAAFVDKLAKKIADSAKNHAWATNSAATHANPPGATIPASSGPALAANDPQNKPAVKAAVAKVLTGWGLAASEATQPADFKTLADKLKTEFPGITHWETHGRGRQPR